MKSDQVTAALKSDITWPIINLALAILVLAITCLAEDARLDKFLPKGDVVKKEQFDLAFSEKYKTPVWVAYILDERQEKHTFPRDQESFHKDPDLDSSKPATYDDSGWDRGHMCPADDMEFDKKAIKETFATSNIVPQYPEMNRGAWKKLENEVRALQKKEGELLVVFTGPVYLLHRATKPALADGTRPPDLVFKVVHCPAGKWTKSWMAYNQAPGQTATGQEDLFECPLAEIEDWVGVKFPFNDKRSEPIRLENL